MTSTSPVHLAEAKGLLGLFLTHNTNPQQPHGQTHSWERTHTANIYRFDVCARNAAYIISQIICMWLRPVSKMTLEVELGVRRGCHMGEGIVQYA